MKITFKNKCNIPLFVIPTCSESFFKDMIYKERFPTSGNDASINGYTFNIINQSLSTKIRMKANFLHIAQGSISELDTHLEIGKHLGYFSEKDLSNIYALIERIDKMLSGLIKYQKSPHASRLTSYEQKRN